MTVNEIHAALSNAALLFFIALSVWGYWRFFRRQPLDPSYWGALAIGVGLLLFQSGIGAYLWLVGFRPARNIHLLYGIVSIMALPMAYAYTRGRDTHAEVLIYSTTSLITVGLIFRAMATAA